MVEHPDIAQPGLDLGKTLAEFFDVRQEIHPKKQAARNSGSFRGCGRRWLKS
jgi:hypothetical protein